MPENEKDPDEKLLILPLGEESKKITQVISNDTARQIIELLADAPLSASDIAERLQAPLTTITYNLENLESVGLVRVERIKYSEKGREVKIYAPVRKLIVVVPEKTDRKSVADALRKYLGVILAAVLASSLIEFFMRSMGRSAKFMQIDYSLTETPVPAPAIPPAITSTPLRIVNETIKGGEIASTVPAPVQEGAWAVNATATPAAVPPIPTAAHAVTPAPTSIPESVASRAPDIFTSISNTITAHPGLLFLIGCLFVITLLIIMDYRRKRENE
jgi:DNA-binding transcriptional ArsR family regulator